MRFIMMVKGDKNYESGAPPDPKLMAAIDQLTQEMTRAGILLSAEGLFPSAAGAKVRVTKGKLTVTDGPFPEARELIGGFAILEADSKADAIRLGSDFVRLHQNILGPTWEGECEIRQVADL
ncbi:MAG TPA: YciI family protein [Gemmatimonadales bacterium]|jgi:hypothetical protein|nr:YciI family protein [Gemmatimonadales bacterium]